MRKRFLVLVIGTALLSLLLITCTKEYSCKGGPFAEFNIEGAPLTCSPVSIFGSYVTGVVLDSTNYATVIADVKLVGNYTISTSIADGISFSSSGTFAATGKQVVYLKANGTPVEDGSFNIIIPGQNGCNFNLVVKKKAPASYILSGNPVDCSNPVIQGNYTQYILLTNKEKIELNVEVITPGTYTIKADTDGISFSDSGYFSAPGNLEGVIRMFAPSFMLTKLINNFQMLKLFLRLSKWDRLRMCMKMQMNLCMYWKEQQQ